MRRNILLAILSCSSFFLVGCTSHKGIPAGQGNNGMTAEHYSEEATTEEDTAHLNIANNSISDDDSGNGEDDYEDIYEDIDSEEDEEDTITKNKKGQVTHIIGTELNKAQFVYVNFKDKYSYEDSTRFLDNNKILYSVKEYNTGTQIEIDYPDGSATISFNKDKKFEYITYYSNRSGFTLLHLNEGRYFNYSEKGNYVINNGQDTKTSKDTKRTDQMKRIIREDIIAE